MRKHLLLPLRRALVASAALVATTGNAACYSYLPQEHIAGLEGKRANLTLSDSGSVILAPRVGPGVVALDGTLVRDSADCFIVDVVATHQRNGEEADWRGERVRVPHVLVTSVALRTFSTPRTLFASVLAAGGVAAITTALRGKGDNGALGSGTGGKPVPQ
jgi:hypothetical protein